VTGFILNTLFWCLSLYAVTLLKLVVPNQSWRRGCNRVLIHIAEAWIDGNSALMRLTQKTVWDIQVDESLRRDGSYLVISNHRSAIDIPVLQRVFRRRIPFLKFFLKRQLLYVPFLGVAWWALDFPFMRRVSRDAIAKRPELRNQDVENAKRACQKFQGRPVSILNYVEGTRFTDEKRRSAVHPFDICSRRVPAESRPCSRDWATN
jgi:1-acyl-sn-glycerol-3-phosphate acyltransferase